MTWKSVKTQLKKFTFFPLLAIFAAVLLLGGFFPKAEDVGALHFALGVDKTKVSAGEQFQYTVQFKNNGGTDLTNINLSQGLSSDVTYVPGSADLEKNGVHTPFVDAWMTDGPNFGTLTPGGEMWFRFSAKINAGVAVGTIVNSRVQVRTDQEQNWVTSGMDVTVVSKDEKTSFQGGDFLKVNNNTTSSTKGDSADVLPGQVSELFTTIINTGSFDARNVKISADLSDTNMTTVHPRVTISSDNADSMTDQVAINAPEKIGMVYKTGHATLFGSTDLYNCPNGCLIPESFYHLPLNLGTVKQGESNSIQVNFKVDVVRTTIPSPTPPACNTQCGNSTECPSNLFCYIPQGQERGNCRIQSDVNSTTCTPPVTPTPTPTPTPPACNTTCSSNNNCPSYLFCFKQSGQDSGVCRRESNHDSVTCETPNEGGFIVMKYQDDNSDGSRESEEKGLDWSFQWDLNGDNNWRDYVTYADKNGEGGRVGGLHEGDQVRIREIGKTGWVATTATQVTITINQGNTATVRFGNRPTQPTVTITTPPTKLPSTGVDIVAQMFGSVGLGAFGVYLRRRKLV